MISGRPAVARRLERAHDAGQRAFVGDRQRAVAAGLGALEQLARAGRAALEAEVRQAVQLGVAGAFMRTSRAASTCRAFARRRRIGPGALAVRGVAPRSSRGARRRRPTSRTRCARGRRGCAGARSRSGIGRGSSQAGARQDGAAGLAHRMLSALARLRLFGAGIGAAAQAVHARRRPGARAGVRAALPRAAPAAGGVEQVAAGRHERRQLAREQAQRHAPAPGSCLAFQARRAPVRTAARGIALGARAGRRPGRCRRLRVVFEQQREALHAAVAAGEVGGEVAGQAAQREQQRLSGARSRSSNSMRSVEAVRRPVVAQRRRRCRRAVGRGGPAGRRRSGAPGRRAAARSSWPQRAQAHRRQRRGRPRPGRRAGAIGTRPSVRCSCIRRRSRARPSWHAGEHAAPRARSVPARCDGESRARSGPRAGVLRSRGHGPNRPQAAR